MANSYFSLWNMYKPRANLNRLWILGEQNSTARDFNTSSTKLCPYTVDTPKEAVGLCEKLQVAKKASCAIMMGENMRIPII